MTLIANAVNSIQLGVEDLASADSRRLLSAVRNVQAGILLLAKEHLRRLSPDGEALLKQKLEPYLIPGGRLSFRGTGNKTVDTQGIKERFRSLGISFDWSEVDKITKIRNDMEHMFFQGSDALAKEAVSDAFLPIRNLITTVLDEEPAQLLGAECWTALLANNKIFTAQFAACRETLDAIKWITEGAAKVAEVLSCTECGSKLVKQRELDNQKQSDAQFTCTACGKDLDTTKVMVAAVSEAYFADAYLAMTDGGPEPVGTCPECGEDTYIFDEGGCVLCEFVMPEDAVCAICHEQLTLEDYETDTGMCSYHRWVVEKDD